MENKKLLKQIAFYLPQFHAIKENNEWWGDGFTEWTNAQKAKPLFEGHEQPIIPHKDVGYYDLNDENVLIKQAEMAKEYGIYGFCFYHYWFNGKRLLEMPVDRMIKNKKPDMPFCLCWANENWTRRWDGNNDEILIAQNYSFDSNKRFMQDIMPYLKDERYIRIDGKPVLLIYRVKDIPKIKQAVELWRDMAQKELKEDLYLIDVHGRYNTNPNENGFDAALEFTPNLRSGGLLEPDNYPDFYDPNTDPMDVFDYQQNVVGTVLNSVSDEYKLFRCVYPSWDNTARRGLTARIGLNPSLKYFEIFLKEMMKYTLDSFKPSEQIVFINAWNEWAEACHLEPDEKHGYEYLNICKKLNSLTRDELFKFYDEQLYFDMLKSMCIDKIKQQEQEISKLKSSSWYKIGSNIKSVERGIRCFIRGKNGR